MSNTNNVITTLITTLITEEGLSKRDKLGLGVALALAPAADGLLTALTEAVRELPSEIRAEREISRAHRALTLRQLARDLARIDEEEEAARERKERARKERERKEREAEREELKRELRAELRAEGRRKR